MVGGAVGDGDTKRGCKLRPSVEGVTRPYATGVILERFCQLNPSAVARKLGFFGAPTFVTQDGELFWGDDRLEQALEWARNTERT